VIIFSQDEEAHIKHLEWGLKSLQEANISVEKSHFFKKSVSFLEFIVTSNGATTDSEKVKPIKEFSEPKTVFEVRSFLGLASYIDRCYRLVFHQRHRCYKSHFEHIKGRERNS